MNYEHLNRRISFMPQPETVRLVHCPACGINTNHRLTASSDAWICWCGCETTAAELDARPEWDAETILKREG